MKNDKLIIDRRFWDRGRGNQALIKNKSVQLIGHNGMCCLGFYGVHLGIDPEILWDWGEPAECINGENEDFDEDVFGGILEYDETEDEPFITSDVSEHLMHSNDGEYKDEAKREADIIKYFVKINVDVSFIN